MRRCAAFKPGRTSECPAATPYSGIFWMQVFMAQYFAHKGPDPKQISTYTSIFYAGWSKKNMGVSKGMRHSPVEFGISSRGDSRLGCPASESEQAQRDWSSTRVGTAAIGCPASESERAQRDWSTTRVGTAASAVQRAKASELRESGPAPVWGQPPRPSRERKRASSEKVVQPRSAHFSARR
jgi:hypothetical protein